MHLGRLIESMPKLEKINNNKSDCMKWLSRAYAIVKLGDDMSDKVQFKHDIEILATGSESLTQKYPNDFKGLQTPPI